ncbi:MAG: hypothetical protein K8H88_20985 [Sandaracinaceae bacterium]|nr:hypothetical protein [Sandaracinaceae bacterium]
MISTSRSAVTVLLLFFAPSSGDAQACPAGTSWSAQHGLCVAAPYGGASAPSTGGALPQAGYPQLTPRRPFTPQPLTYVSQPLWGLFVAGMVTFGVMYVLTVSVTAALDADFDDPWLYVPLLGPWLEAGFGGDRESWTALWVPSGILQLAGAVMMILGLAIQQQVPVYADLERGLRVADGLRMIPFGSPADGSAGALLALEL